LFLLTRALWKDNGSAGAVAWEKVAPVVSTGAALRVPLVWLHIITFFIYTGLEVAVGQWSFTILTESRRVPTALAGGWVTLYWAGILAGRIGFGFVVDRIGIDRLIRWSTVAALGAAAVFVWDPFPLASPIALLVAGLGLAVIFPCLMTRTPQRLGPEIAAHAVGFQVGAAMLGAAALPGIAGYIAQHFGVGRVPLALLVMAAALVLIHEAVLLGGRARDRPES
jgi:fucose permease